MEAAFQSAYASTLLQNVIKLIGCIIAEYKRFQRSEEAIRKLETTTIRARNLFSSINTFQLDDSIRLCLQDRLDTMAILCLDIEDLIEDILDAVTQNSSSKKPILNFMLKHPTRQYDIDDLQRKLDKVHEEVKSIVELTSQTRAQNSSCNGDPGMKSLMPLIGREEDITNIIQKITSTGSDHNGVSILGMDGLGKTVLAEAILADKRISGEFCCIRVPLVEGCFDFNKAIHQLELIVGNMGILKQQNQRLLMLFDNLLEIKLTQWNEFWKHMKTQCGAYSEIKILITSFNPRVSQTTRTAEFYLKRLSEENCKQVIVENALFFKKDLPKLHLSVVADTLATKCEGLPQLARILGMFLARDGMNDWRGRLNKDLRDMSDVRSEIVSTLRLSYLTMQPQLKRCLAYLALFPHKYSFIMDDLIHLLVAEGIIQHNEGKEYFSDLQGMSVLQHLEDINHTEKPKYELHKFSHIFSQLDASKICLRLEQCESSICDSLKIENVRHLSLLCGDIQPTTWTKLEKFKRLRTFVSLNDRRTGQVPRQLFKALVRLRVLKLSNTDITALPDSIHRLKRLRSLDISFTPINKLPKTLCKLSNLQFFNLTKTLHLFHLPQQFHKLTNMLFLDWESSDINRLHLPSHIGKLRSLQTLPLFIVGDSQLGFCISELKYMDCLKGSICIQSLENVPNRAMAEEAMLIKKELLKKIELKWMNLVHYTVAEEVLTGLKPHFCLSELKVINYGGKLFPEWICDPIGGLQKLHLMKCPSCEVLPALGKLETLETLILEEFAGLTSMDSLFCGRSSDTAQVYFPKLKSLTLKKLVLLREWTELRKNDLPRLQNLKIESCPELINLPSLIGLTSLGILEIEHCPNMTTPELPPSLKIPMTGVNNVPATPDRHNQNVIFQGYQIFKDKLGGFFCKLTLRYQQTGAE